MLQDPVRMAPMSVCSLIKINECFMDLALGECDGAWHVEVVEPGGWSLACHMRAERVPMVRQDCAENAPRVRRKRCECSMKVE